eukprot:m.412602 g.412602  ORF g.412602 m.412602 type:complete len:310 (-) comp28890_c0_seq1:214-1143(-)
MTTLVDTHAWDLPNLDFFHLPFESDQDILELSCREQERETVDDYSTSILLTPPYSGPSCEEHFSFDQDESDSTATLGAVSSMSNSMAASDILLGSSSARHALSSTNWATPPASPPPSAVMGPAAPNSRFSFSFTSEQYAQYVTADADLSSSEDDLDSCLDSWNTAPNSPSSTAAPRRRKSVGGASKSRHLSKSNIEAALTAMSRATSSPTPPLSWPGSSDEAEEPETKRKSHNVLERKRRNDLKNSYQELRVQLPHLSENVRAPTGHILTKAVEYIEELKVEYNTHLQELDDLRARNSRAKTLLRSIRV